MNAAAKINASALPMPTVTEGDAIKVGGWYPAPASNVREVVIGDVTLLAGTEAVYDYCGRCGGKGGFGHYGHVYGGVCYGCNGSGISRFADTMDKAQRKVRSGQAAAMRAQAAADQAAAEYAAALPAKIEAAHVEALAEQVTRDEAAAAAAAKTASQRYAGEVGSKIAFTGKVVVTFACESVYGTRYMVVIEGEGDDAGAVVKTTGTSKFHYAAERGDVVTIKATVKEHDVYNGTKQTVVIRPKAV